MQDRIRESGTRMSTTEPKPGREVIGQPRARSVRHVYVAGDHSRVLGWEPTESLEPRVCVDVTVCVWGGGGDLDTCWDGTVWGRDYVVWWHFTRKTTFIHPNVPGEGIKNNIEEKKKTGTRVDPAVP
ncbi:unnamed protein product [Gadus morhua 'NCC']